MPLCYNVINLLIIAGIEKNFIVVVEASATVSIMPGKGGRNSKIYTQYLTYCGWYKSTSS